MTENPKFHRKLIETDSMLMIEDMLVATNNVDKSYRVDQNEMEEMQDQNSSFEM